MHTHIIHASYAYLTCVLVFILFSSSLFLTHFFAKAIFAVPPTPETDAKSAPFVSLAEMGLQLLFQYDIQDPTLITRQVMKLRLESAPICAIVCMHVCEQCLCFQMPLAEMELNYFSFFFLLSLQALSRLCVSFSIVLKYCNQWCKRYALFFLILSSFMQVCFCHLYACVYSNTCTRSRVIPVLP